MGVPHDPMAFLEKAIDVGHPKDLGRHVDPTMHEVLMDNFHKPTALVGHVGALTSSRSTLSLQRRPKQKSLN